MKKHILVLLLASIMAKGFGQVVSNFSYPSSVNLFGLFEISFRLSQAYSNPYDPDTINIYAVFTDSNNNSDTVNAFYYEHYTFQLAPSYYYEVASHNTSHFDGWRIRFTPGTVGTWSFFIKAFDKNGELSLPLINASHTFTCNSVSNADGFITKANSRFLKREVVKTGHRYFHSFFPIGPNVARYECNYVNVPPQPIYSQPQGIYYYEKYIDSLYGNANYMRIWLNRYQALSLYGPEYTQLDGQGNPIVYFDSTINQKDSAELDYIIEYAAQHGIAVMPCVFSFGDFRSYNSQEPNDPSIWAYNPFNTIIGGPKNFFSNTNAKRITKNLLRYIVSRWGYATNIMCWELWNEVSNMFKGYDDGTGNLQDSVLAWHNEMAHWVRICDPYKHCVSTSMGTTAKTCDSASINYNDSLYLSLFDTLDLVLQHNYQNINKAKSAEQISKKLYDKTTQAHVDYPTKPFFMGEFGFGQSHGPYYADKDSCGIDLHNSLWSSLFSTAIGPASMWWWGYLNDCRLYHNRYSPLLTFCQNLPVLSGTFTPCQTGQPTGSFGHILEFPNNLETYYMINATEDTIYGWAQDTAFAYQSLRWLTDSVQSDTAKPYYLHFMDSIVFDTLGYVYKLTINKRPGPSYNSSIIDIPISNQPVGTDYTIQWYNTETGYPYNYHTSSKVRLDNNGHKVLRIGFPSIVRNLKNNTINNNFGDAVFVLIKDNGSQNKKKQPTLE